MKTQKGSQATKQKGSKSGTPKAQMSFGHIQTATTQKGSQATKQKASKEEKPKAQMSKDKLPKAKATKQKASQEEKPKMPMQEKEGPATVHFQAKGKGSPPEHSFKTWYFQDRRGWVLSRLEVDLQNAACHETWYRP